MWKKYTLNIDNDPALQKKKKIRHKTFSLFFEFLVHITID